MLKNEPTITAIGGTIPHDKTTANDKPAVIVYGHESAKREFAIAVCRYKMRLELAAVTSLGNPHVLLAGPVAVGKRLLVRTLAAAAGIPSVTISTSRLGGTDRGNGFAAELIRCGGSDVVRRQRGIVYLDDADELASDPVSQATVAWLLGGTAAPVAVLDGELTTLPTDRLMFVLGGEFQGLDQVVDDRISAGTRMGFVARRDPADLALCTSRIESVDLIEYGFSRELAEKLAVRIAVDRLPVDVLGDMLVRAPDSPLNQAKREFAAAGVKLVVDRGVCLGIAQVAGEGGPSAMALELNRLLDPYVLVVAERVREGFGTLSVTAGPSDGPRVMWQRGGKRQTGRVANASVTSRVPVVLPPRAARVGRIGRKWASESDLSHQFAPVAAPHDTRLPSVTAVVESCEGSRLRVLDARTLSISDDTRRRHVLVAGATGSGKTARVILPILNSDIADRERAVVLIDAQMELTPAVYAMHRRYRPDAPFYYLNFTEPHRSMAWNPFHRVRTRADAAVIAHTIKSAVKEDSKDTPFFREQATSILARLIHAVRKGDPGSCNPGYIQRMIGTSGRGIRRIAELGGDATLVEVADLLAAGHSNTQTTIQELENFLRAWDHDHVAATTTRNEFSFDAIDAAVAPTIVVALPEELVEMLRPATACFVIELLQYVMARGRGTAGLPARPVSLVIDEFASAVGRLPELAVRINTLRKRGLCLVAAVQSVRQIITEYGPDPGRNLIGGFRTRVFVPPVEEVDAEIAAEMSGYHVVQRVLTADGLTPSQVVPTREPVLNRDEVNAVSVHPELGPRTTWLMPGTNPFQAYCPALYMDPAYRDITAATGFPPERKSPLRFDAPTSVETTSPGKEPIFTDTSNWSVLEIKTKLDEVQKSIDWEKTTGNARRWWEGFCKENAQKLSLVLRVAEELATRKATITEFFLTYVDSNTNNIQANLHYLDYLRSKRDKK